MHHETTNFTYLILNYNESDYLYKTLEKMIGFNLMQNEIIIIDDTSVDNSLDMINKIDISKYNITIIRNEKNIGYNKSLKKGLDSSNGEFIISFTPGDILNKIDFQRLQNSNENDLVLGLKDTYINTNYTFINNFKKKLSSLDIYYDTNSRIVNPLTTVIGIKKRSYDVVINKMGDLFSQVNLIKQFIKMGYSVIEISLYTTSRERFKHA